MEKTVVVESGTSMKATHTCMKICLIGNRIGEKGAASIPALYAKSSHQDLLSGKACNRGGIRMILDADPDIAGLYLLDKDQQPHTEESIPCIREPTYLYLLKWRKKNERI
jgi:hypothetical protein